MVITPSDVLINNGQESGLTCPMCGNHTVRRSNKQWAGIWTDLSIEQILMKFLKGKGGVIGKGVTENVLKVWTKTMHRCAEITDALTIVSSLSNSDDKHKEHLHRESNVITTTLKKYECGFIYTTHLKLELNLWL